MSFVLYTINVVYLCDASYVTLKYRHDKKHHVIFVRKYKTFQKIQYRVPDSIVVEPHFFFLEKIIHRLFKTCVDINMSQTGDKQRDRQTDGRTDKQKDGV